MLSVVIAGLDPAIHEALPYCTAFESFPELHVIMDARVEPAHDAEGVARSLHTSLPG
jgi:hypothetical protein